MSKNIVTFSYISKYWYMPILLPIFCAITHNFQRRLAKEVLSSFSMSDYLFPSLIYIFISKIFSIILCLISIIKNQKESEKIKTSESDSNVLVRRYHLNVRSLKKSIIFLQIFIISFLETIFKAEDYFNIFQKGAMIEKRIGFGILVPLLYHFLIKKLHRHHLLAIIIYSIGYIILIIEFILTEEKAGFATNFFHLLFTIPFSISLVMTKSLMDHYFVSPFTFLFLDGVCCVINSFIVILFQTIFLGGTFFVKNFEYLALNGGKYSLLYLIGQIFFSFFYYLMNALTIYYFTPLLLVITDFLSPLITFVAKIIRQEGTIPKEELIIIRLIGYFIVIFGACILNEIIILNFLDLNKDTRINITSRGILEDIDLARNLRLDSNSIGSSGNHNSDEILSDGGSETETVISG